MVSLRDYALRYIEMGISCISAEADKHPMLIDRDKGIRLSWAKYQKRLPNKKEVNAWKWDSIGLIAGKVSGNLLCIDLDSYHYNGNLGRDYCKLVSLEDSSLISKLVIEKTQSGGSHLIFRSDKEVAGNQKIANKKDNKCIIETRGEGGYFIGYPSPNYTLIQGSYDSIPVLNDREVSILLKVGRSFNEKPVEYKNYDQNINASEETPLNSYDKKSTIQDMHKMLIDHKWTNAFERNGTIYLTRPGKDKGISASLNHVEGKFFVFSSSTCFEAGRTFKASQLYAFLEHGGDFRSAAKELYAQGYGNPPIQRHATALDAVEDSTVKKDTTLSLSPVAVVKVDQILPDLQSFIKNGMERGLNPGWPNLEKHYRMVRGNLNIVTGIPSHGKTAWVENLLIKAAKNHSWKTLIFSPENYPLELHITQFIERVSGKKVPSKGVDIEKDAWARTAIKFINDHFTFMPIREDGTSLDVILQAAGEGKYDSVLIDPWNEVENTKPRDVSDHEFIGKCLSRCRNFARSRNISFWIVAHPTKMSKEGGSLPIPHLYDISGSAHWYNKADNGFSVFRDFDNSTTTVQIQKIKFRYYGAIGEINFSFDLDTGIFKPIIGKQNTYFKG